MRLRTLESFFLLQSGLLYSYPSLKQSLDTEIVVIGGGVTGALISDALLEAGYDVTLLDRRDIGQGSTAATTAMLQYETDEPLTRLAATVGLDAATHCYRKGIRAIEGLDQLIRLKNLSCGFERKESIYFAHNRQARQSLRDEYQLMHRQGFEVDWLPESDVFETYHLQSKGAIRSATAGSVDAYRLAHELIAHNVARGLQVYDQTQVKNIQFSESGHRIAIAEQEVELRCKTIVFCSGFETLEWLPKQAVQLYDTYVCISEPGIALPEKSFGTLFWNTEDPYLYFRTTDDHRLLVGGLDTPNTSAAKRYRRKASKSKALQRKIRTLIPDLSFTEDFTWAGTFGVTRDSLPYIGAHPEFPATYFVLGFGGNGITFSYMGRQILLDLLSGISNPLAHLFRFGR